MKRLLLLPCLGGVGVLCSFASDLSSPAAILQKVSERYQHLTTYQIQAEVNIVIARQGASGSITRKVLLAVGTQGAYRVDQDSNTGSEISVSDGKVTWKADPKKKVWSKQEVSHVMAADSDSDDDTDEPLAQDLFSQTERSFVARYASLTHYANTASLEKTDKAKFNGAKVECYVIAIPLPNGVTHLYIDKDTFYVVRHIEKSTGPEDSRLDIKTDYKQVTSGMPAAELFEYQPPSGSKEVDTLLLPSERNLTLVGQQAFDFTLKNLEGSPVHLADLHGKVVLLDFWATWCPPCRHELPTIEALSRKYKDHNLVVYGVNDEDVGTAKKFLEKHHPDLDTLHDSGKVYRTYGCSSIPTVLVIDPNGKIVAHFVGERSEGELIAALKQAGMN